MKPPKECAECRVTSTGRCHECEHTQVWEDHQDALREEFAQYGRIRSEIERSGHK
ncbi:MAG: hypothetical protein IMZ50_17650 [Candidatus Atribacteria bacterium]|nr:hypothetical protein [Candidatus Atribacteria bacterium]